MGELPSQTGASDVFKQRIDAAIADFENRWGWLITPLVVPVGLQVIMQPNASTATATQHDLDNIVRDYLLPKIIPKFGTVTDHKWTIDFEEMKRTAPEVAKRWQIAKSAPGYPFSGNSLAVRSKLLSDSYSPIIERPTGQPFTKSTGIVTCGAPA